MSLHAVSLFTNCGAGDFGYQKAGFSFRVVAEKDHRRAKVAAHNLKGSVSVPGDVRETLDEVVAAWHDAGHDAAPALLCACPPCQGMSSARAYRRGGTEGEPDDPRNLLITAVADAVERFSPRAVVLENVPRFLTRPVLERDGVKLSAPDYLLERVRADYAAYPVLLDLADYGVPQRRRRTFLTLIRRGEPAIEALDEAGTTPYPKPSERTTMVAELERRGLSGVPTRTRVVTGDGGWERSLHVAPEWQEGDWRRRMVEATAPNGGSAWDNDVCSGECGRVEVGPDDAVCPMCLSPLLRPVVRGDDGAYRLIKGFRNSSYRRHDGRTVAATITTASGRVGSDTTLHPTEHRLLSVAECGVIQTFPEDFDWDDAPTAWGLGPVRAMIGEAVPPLFTRQHGDVLVRLLGGGDAGGFLPVGDARHVRARAKLRAFSPSLIPA